MDVGRKSGVLILTPGFNLYKGNCKNNMRDEIPQWSWYNGQFLFKFDEYLKSKKKDISLEQFYQDFITENEIPEGIFHTKNQGVVISLLYSLLVIPIEIWERDNTNFRFNYSDYFEILEGIFNNTNDFLRFFRNSISHANFSINIISAEYIFWNERNGIINFKFKSTHEKLGNFLTLIGKYYINEVRNRNRE